MWQPLSVFLESWNAAHPLPEAPEDPLVAAFFAPQEPEIIQQLRQLDAPYPDVIADITRAFRGHISFTAARMSTPELSDAERSSARASLTAIGRLLRLFAAAEMVDVSMHLAQAAADFEEPPLGPTQGLLYLDADGPQRYDERPLHGLTEADIEPAPFVVELGGGYGYLPTAGQVLHYPLQWHQWLCIACSTEGRFNPLGCGVDELLGDDRYFPLVGAQHGEPFELESGMAWWRAAAPLPFGVPYEFPVPEGR